MHSNCSCSCGVPSTFFLQRSYSATSRGFNKDTVVTNIAWKVVLCIVGELAGRGRVTVAVSAGDMCNIEPKLQILRPLPAHYLYVRNTFLIDIFNLGPLLMRVLIYICIYIF